MTPYLPQSSGFIVSMPDVAALSKLVTRIVPSYNLPDADSYNTPGAVQDMARRYPLVDEREVVSSYVDVPEGGPLGSSDRLISLTVFSGHGYAGKNYDTVRQGIVARLPSERLPQFYDQVSLAAAESLDTANLKPLLETFSRWSTVASSSYYTIPVPTTNDHSSSMDIPALPSHPSDSPAEVSLGSQVRDFYSSEGWRQVDEFLLQHPTITPLLLEARSHLREIFPEARTISLSLVPGYEEGEHASLYADIFTTSDPMAAFKQMERFEEEWWLDALDDAGGFLRFSVEFD